MTQQEWDVFVSYASEDREAVAHPLAKELEHCGLAVWYDQTQLRVGDSIRREIDEGLIRARYGVVILSPSFFDKHYPEQELDGLAQREQDGAKVILPVWYNVAEEDVRQHSAWLAGRLAAKWEDGIAVVVEKLLDAITSEDDQQAVSGPLRLGCTGFSQPVSYRCVFGNIWLFVPHRRPERRRSAVGRGDSASTARHERHVDADEPSRANPRVRSAGRLPHTASFHGMVGVRSLGATATRRNVRGGTNRRRRDRPRRAQGCA